MIDFCKLNEVKLKKVFAIPRMDDIFDQLGNNRFIFSLDLASGYHCRERKGEYCFQYGAGSFRIYENGVWTDRSSGDILTTDESFSDGATWCCVLRVLGWRHCCTWEKT